MVSQYIKLLYHFNLYFIDMLKSVYELRKSHAALVIDLFHHNHSIITEGIFNQQSLDNLSKWLSEAI